MRGLTEVFHHLHTVPALPPPPYTLTPPPPRRPEHPGYASCHSAAFFFFFCGSLSDETDWVLRNRDWILSAQHLVWDQISRGNLAFVFSSVKCLAQSHKSSATSVVSDSEIPWTVACQGSSVHGILQARILEWAAMGFSKGFSQPRDGTRPCYIPHIGRWVL